MKRKHLGSKFEDLLAKDGVLEACRASAIKFKIARELEKAMNDRNMSKAEIAKRLKTSRTGVDRLLDPENTSITLNTMAKVASLLGKRIEFALRKATAKPCMLSPGAARQSQRQDLISAQVARRRASLSLCMTRRTRSPAADPFHQPREQLTRRARVDRRGGVEHDDIAGLAREDLAALCSGPV